MLAIILWVVSLIIWIINLIVKIRLPMKNATENGFHILIAVLFIILSVVNIVGRVISLNSDASPETISETTEAPIEEQREELYYIEESY